GSNVSPGAIAATNGSGSRSGSVALGPPAEPDRSAADDAPDELDVRDALAAFGGFETFAALGAFGAFGARSFIGRARGAMTAAGRRPSAAASAAARRVRPSIPTRPATVSDRPRTAAAGRPRPIVVTRTAAVTRTIRARRALARSNPCIEAEDAGRS